VFAALPRCSVAPRWVSLGRPLGPVVARRDRRRERPTMNMTADIPK
jgi:hypothetical protein